MRSSSWTSLHSNVHSEAIIVLYKEQKEFPVYWGHYSCWLAIVKINLQLFQHEYADIVRSDITSEDLEWTILCLDLVNEVKGRMDDLDDEKKTLIEQAQEVAESIHKDIALCVLGSKKTYVKRVCEEYGGNVDPSCSNAVALFLTGIFMLSVLFLGFMLGIALR